MGTRYDECEWVRTAVQKREAQLRHESVLAHVRTWLATQRGVRTCGPETLSYEATIGSEVRP
jgi:hypothetical protein